jgi:lipopolysaccharide biosynthesis regulator YciM
MRVLQKVQQYDETYAGEASAAMLECMEQAGDDPQVTRLLEEILESETGSRQVLVKVAATARQKGNTAALQALQASLATHPSLGVLARMLSTAASEPGDRQQVLQQGAAALEQHLQTCPQYRCDNCGFDLKHLYWLCPGCSKWGTVRPLEDNISSV